MADEESKITQLSDEDTDIRIYELPNVDSLTESALFPIERPDGGSYPTGKVSMAQISEAVVNDFEYADLETDSKRIIGAINEAKGRIGRFYGEVVTRTNITIDGVVYNNANVEIQMFTISNFPEAPSNSFSIGQMTKTDNATLRAKFVEGSALICYMASNGVIQGWHTFYFDSMMPSIKSVQIYNQKITLEAGANTNIPIPEQAGYTAVGLGVCYCGGSPAFTFLMDNFNRVFIRNINSLKMTDVTTRVNVIYARN